MCKLSGKPDVAAVRMPSIKLVCFSNIEEFPFFVKVFIQCRHSIAGAWCIISIIHAHVTSFYETCPLHAVLRDVLAFGRRV